MKNFILLKKQHLLLCYNKQVGIGLAHLNYGFFGLKAISFGILTKKQVEAARRIITRKTKRIGKLFIRIYFNFPITKKPLLSRMGKGSGPISSWVCFVKKGSIIFELNGVSFYDGYIALNEAKSRLPLKTIFISKSFSKGTHAFA